MHELTPEGQQFIKDIAQRHGISVDAALTLLRALVAGHGTMAQFSHPELGGMGQWNQGGMIMVGDMFNHGLKARVDALCIELASLLRNQPSVRVAPSTQSEHQSSAHNVSLFVPGAGCPQVLGGHQTWGSPLLPGLRTISAMPSSPQPIVSRLRGAGASPSMTQATT